MRHIYCCPYNEGIGCSRRPCAERCSLCGHNPIEAARRSGFIQAGGLKRDAHGIARLHLRRPAGL